MFHRTQRKSIFLLSHIKLLKLRSLTKKKKGPLYAALLFNLNIILLCTYKSLNRLMMIITYSMKSFSKRSQTFPHFSKIRIVYIFSTTSYHLERKTDFIEFPLLKDCPYVYGRMRIF